MDDARGTSTSGPIFVGGSGRSGTTILSRTLGLHPHIFTIPNEMHLLSDERAGLVSWLHAPESALLARNFRRNMLGSWLSPAGLREVLAGPRGVSLARRLRSMASGRFYLRATPALAEPVGLCSVISRAHHEACVHRLLEHFPAASVEERYRQVREFLDALLAPALAASGGRRWCDDTIDNVAIGLDLHRIHPDMRLVHVIRDGRDVARAYVRLGWSPNEQVALRGWFSRVSIGRRVGAALPSGRYLEVVFERLVADPEPELRRVLSFLGESWCPEMEGHRLSGERATSYREASPELERLFHALAGDMARELGWPLREP